MRQDLEAGLKGIVRFDELQFGLAAPEQRGEKLAEILVYGAEGIEQALAAFPVEVLDGAAQFGDRLGHIVAFLGEAIELLCYFLGFFLSPEIYAAQSLAVVAQGRELALHLIERRHLALFKTGRLNDLGRRAIERFRDAALGLGVTLAR
jgi:hypothetical protein